MSSIINENYMFSPTKSWILCVCVYVLGGGELEFDAPGIAMSLILSLKLRNAVIEKVAVLNE